MPSLFFRALLIAALAIPVCAQAPVGEKTHSDDPRARQQYLEQLRSGGDPASLPPGARLRALEEQNEMIRREGERYRQAAAREGGVAGQLPTSSQWLFIGPQPSSAGASASSGRTTAMVVDPHDSSGNNAYIGGAQGGVWKTTDGGTTWTPLTDFQASLAVGSMAIDGSTNPATVYVGTGEQSFSADSYYGAGILKSVDGGTTWTQLGANSFAGAVAGCNTSGTLCGGAFIGGLSTRPGTPSTLLAAVKLFGGDGIYRSTDSGVNWARATGTTAVANAVQYATSDIAYAGMSGSGVWKSIDGGANWNPANGTGANVITTASTGRVELAVALSDTNGTTVYASLADSVSANGLSGFYKTIDGGLNWTKLGPNYDATSNPSGLRNYCSPQCWYDNIVAVHPTNANVVFVGGSAVTGFISKSVNGGTSWT
ncbi:MAG: sialidase family protein, partial [Terriglobales bacterium]